MANRGLDFDFINDQLLIGKTPKRIDYIHLKELGVKLVVNMRAERYAWPIGDRKLIKTVWVPTFDSKFLPIKPRTIASATGLANKTIKRGGKVYVYCLRGRHRSVLMSAAILITQGQTVESAIRKIKSKHDIADPDIAHIHRAIVQFYDLWNHKV